METQHCQALGNPDILVHVDPKGDESDLWSLIEVESIHRQRADIDTQRPAISSLAARSR